MADGQLREQVCPPRSAVLPAGRQGWSGHVTTPTPFLGFVISKPHTRSAPDSRAWPPAGSGSWWPLGRHPSPATGVRGPGMSRQCGRLPDPQARGGPGSRGRPMNPDSDSAEPRTSTREPRSCCPCEPRLRVLETQTQVTWKSLETWLTTACLPQDHAMSWQCPAPRFEGGRGGGSQGHSPRTHGWLAAARTCFSQSLLPGPRLGLQPGRSVGPRGLSAWSPEFLPHLVGRPSQHLTPTQLASDLQRSTPQALSPAAWVSSLCNPQEVSSQPRPHPSSLWRVTQHLAE